MINDDVAKDDLASETPGGSSTRHTRGLLLQIPLVVTLIGVFMWTAYSNRKATQLGYIYSEMTSEQVGDELAKRNARRTSFEELIKLLPAIEGHSADLDSGERIAKATNGLVTPNEIKLEWYLLKPPPEAIVVTVTYYRDRVFLAKTIHLFTARREMEKKVSEYWEAYRMNEAAEFKSVSDDIAIADWGNDRRRGGFYADYYNLDFYALYSDYTNFPVELSQTRFLKFHER